MHPCYPEKNFCCRYLFVLVAKASFLKRCHIVWQKNIFWAWKLIQNFHCGLSSFFACRNVWPFLQKKTVLRQTSTFFQKNEVWKKVKWGCWSTKKWIFCFPIFYISRIFFTWYFITLGWAWACGGKYQIITVVRNFLVPLGKNCSVFGVPGEKTRIFEMKQPKLVFCCTKGFLQNSFSQLARDSWYGVAILKPWALNKSIPGRAGLVVTNG